jgi:alpha-D-xyloside xylohydrolase
MCPPARLLLATLAVLPACGTGDAGLDPAPAELTAGPVTIATDPLRLRIAGPAGGLEQTGFVELATVASIDPIRYYDPRDTGAIAMTWTTPARALGVDRDGWLVLEGGARLRLREGDAAQATLELDAADVAGAVLARLVLPIDPGEPIFGFGESFGGADAHGQVREAQFRVDLEMESSINEVHVPVPLAMWPRRGAGLFVADRRTGAFDLGAARPGEVLVTFGPAARGPLPVHLFVAAEPLDLVRRYVALTARPAVPPRWALAPQQWRNAHESSDEMRQDAHAMRQLGVPGSVMWIDNPWQTGYNTFVVDEGRFAGFDALMAELRALGYRVIFWSTPYLQNTGETQADYRRARERGWLVTDDGGTVIDFPWNHGPVGVVDLTHPEAVAFWRERIARIVDRGASGFKLDYGEELVPEIGGTLLPLRVAAGDVAELGGLYQRYYHDAYLGALPPGDGFLITRAGAWGEQDRNPCIWPGDLDSDFSRHGVDNGAGKRNVGGLPAAIAGGLSLSVSGYPFYGSDIGGYREGTPTTEVLIRWAQYAALGTVMQLGGGGPHHNPWDPDLYDPVALEVYREYARLHLDLNPHLWTLALAAGADGTPVTRPCRFVHPEAGCDDAMFLLGDALLVAPVIEAGATTRQVVLPPGRWLDWWDGSALDGDGQTAREVPAPLTRMPLWLAADRFVAMFARAADTLEPATAPGVTSYADPALGRELRLVVAPAGGAPALTLHDGAAATGAPDGAGYRLTFTPGDQYDIVTFELRGRTAAAVRAGGAALPAVADRDAVASCPPPGCWWADDAGGRVWIRAHATDGAARTIAVE